MKKEIKTLFAGLILMFVSFSVNAQDRKIPKDQIPKQIKAYIATYFPKNAVVKASFDNHPVYKKYEISLTNKVSLEFSPDYKIMEIKSKSKLPDAVIPAQILRYVKANYPNNVITDWELDDGNQQVELNNGRGLKFNLKEEFIKIED